MNKRIKKNFQIAQEMIKWLSIKRFRDIPKGQKEKLSIVIFEAKTEIIKSYSIRHNLDFDKQLINILKDDPRIKNYLWYYYRRKSKKVPLEKELQVLEVLKENLGIK